MRTLSGTPTLVALACLVPVSVWWFMQMMNPYGDIAAIGNTTSLQAINAVLVLQLVGIALFGPEISSPVVPGREDRWSLSKDVIAVTAFVLPALPLLAMLGLASGLTVITLVRAVCAVFAAGFATVLAGQWIRRAGLAREMTRVLHSSLGIVAASFVWIFRQDVLLWTGL